MIFTATVSPVTSIVEVFQETFDDPMMLVFFCLIIIFAVFSSLSPSKSKLTRARWAGRGEKLLALKTARKQLKSHKINKVCLYSGSFKKWQMWGIIPDLTTFIVGNSPSLFVPSANQSMEVCGRPNSGKTYSFIDRVVVSGIEQGFPILLYDYKGGSCGEGGQIPFIATYAARHGYKVRIFAPGRDYTCILNPLDFIRDNRDMTTAQALAKNFHANLRGDTGKTDGFFGPAGQRLIYALFMLAKGTIYPDLAMSFSFMQLTHLAKRLEQASTKNLSHFPFWVQVGFKQLIQVAEAEQTSGGILAGAADLLTEFMQYDLLPCYLGKSNTSLYLKEKEIIIFQSDIFRSSVVNPLLASNIDTLINLNFADQRKIPLICSFDEVPTITISNLPTWANEHRSKGYCGIYGFQSLEQLEKAYGKDGASILRSALGTRVWFNPGNEQTAKVFSTYLGEKEVVIKQKSTSRNVGGQMGGQRSVSEQSQLTPLLRSDDFTGFRQGECVYINSAYQSSDRGDIPLYLRKIRVPKSDRNEEERCSKMWESRLLPKLIKREIAARGKLDLEREIQLRMKLADKLLPLPPELKSSNAQTNFVPDLC